MKFDKAEMRTTFRGNLHTALTSSKTPVADFAKRLDITPAAVSNWLTGKRLPDTGLLPVVAHEVGKLLGTKVTIEALLTKRL